MKTTIQERGPVLPVGVDPPGGGSRVREYSFRRWTAKVELEIGKVRDANRTITPAAFVTEALARLITKWGPYCFDEHVDEAARLVILKRSYAADVYHAWIDIRRSVMGNEADVPLVCGTCKTSFVFAVNLGTIDETTVEDGDPMRTPLTFRDGFEYRGEVRKVVQVEPIRWMTVEAIGQTAGMNLGAVKIGTIEGAIAAIDGIGEVRLGPAALDDLSKFDLEHGVAQVEAVQPGPTLAIEVGCPQCRSPIRRAINWTYDSFFSAGSSRSVIPAESERRSSSSPTASPDSSTR